MVQTDYIVIGLGIAAIAACEQLQRLGKSFVVIDSGNRTATRVAGGVVNPVVLKRFTPVWKAREFLQHALPFYAALSKKLNVAFVEERDLLRAFASTEEQNNWTIAGDSPLLEPFLDTEIIKNKNSALQAKHGLGKVLNAFRVDTTALLDAYSNYLENDSRLRNEVFDYNSLEVRDDVVQYKDIMAGKVIFAEGPAAVNNPFLKGDFLIPKKGEYIIVKAPTLKLKEIVKGPFFLIPLENDRYMAGATFAHGDYEFAVTEKGRKQLLKAVSAMIGCPFEVVDQLVGMRPTIKDRRPVLGSLDNENILFFNGLGTRGLLMAPLLSGWLTAYAERGEKLPSEVDIRRFSNV